MKLTRKDVHRSTDFILQGKEHIYVGRERELFTKEKRVRTTLNCSLATMSLQDCEVTHRLLNKKSYNSRMPKYFPRVGWYQFTPALAAYEHSFVPQR